MLGCIFCKILKGDIPNYTVYEDNHVLAFLDINPHAKGHTVVIPKVHSEVLFDLNDEMIGYIFGAVKKVAEKLDRKLSPDGFNFGWNHGESGGQVVPHLHIHIIPRWNNDMGGSVHSIVNNPGEQSVEEIAKLFE